MVNLKLVFCLFFSLYAVRKISRVQSSIWSRIGTASFDHFLDVMRHIVARWTVSVSMFLWKRATSFYLYLDISLLVI